MSYYAEQFDFCNKSDSVAPIAKNANESIEKGASGMHQFVTPGKIIISHLSFTHLREIMAVDDPFARYFYEQECMKYTWSVLELRRFFKVPRQGYTESFESGSF